MIFTQYSLIVHGIAWAFEPIQSLLFNRIHIKFLVCSVHLFNIMNTLCYNFRI